jgi:oligoendopeptidase F
MSPFHFLGLPLFIGGLLNESLAFFRIASFFIKGLLNEPLAFFEVASFFNEGLLNKPLCIFWVASFFIEGLLNELMDERSDSAPLFMALVICVKHLSNFQLTLLAVSTML